MADVVESTEIPGVWLIRPEARSDERGRFLETYRSSWLPFAAPMVQANRSDSAAKVLRGLHYHRRQADLWFVQQGGDQELAVYIPEGVAHGFYAHDEVIMTYLVTGEYDGTDELGIAWNDPDLGISWPDEEPILSGRDKENPRLADVPADRRVPYTG
jgi:dTDP-4-dehydrorhamnose 3,5-epimerase